MHSTSFINLPAVISFSAHSVFPAHLVDLDRAVPASGSKRRLAARLPWQRLTSFYSSSLGPLSQPASINCIRSVLDSGIRPDQPHASFDLMCGVLVVQL
jgi:hypothetical protein